MEIMVAATTSVHSVTLFSKVFARLALQATHKKMVAWLAVYFKPVNNSNWLTESSRSGTLLCGREPLLRGTLGVQRSVPFTITIIKLPCIGSATGISHLALFFCLLASNLWSFGTCVKSVKSTKVSK